MEPIYTRLRCKLCSILIFLLLVPEIFSPNVLAVKYKIDPAQLTVTGSITDADSGEPLTGVTITIKGSTQGTVSDINGWFSIAAETGDLLVFSFIGYTPREIQVQDQTNLVVQLEKSLIGLDEVMVIGYGQQKKTLITGAYQTIHGEDILTSHTSVTMNALKGVSPGISIRRLNGLPGSGNKVIVRGLGTIGHFEPLYIVDGVAVEDIDNLSPADIESITILKDASSAAIYGSRGANGIILVQTRKGRRDMKTRVDYSGYIGFQDFPNKPEMLNAQEFRDAVLESYENSGRTYDLSVHVPYWDQIQSGEWKGTNWLDETENKNAPVQSHALNVTGGSAVSKYALGVSWFDQEGIIGLPADIRYRRVSFRLNSEHVIYKTKKRDIITLGENLIYTSEDNPFYRTHNQQWNDFRPLLQTNPFLPMYAESDDDPAYPYHSAISFASSQPNPVAYMAVMTENYKIRQNTQIGSIFLQIDPWKNLRFRSTFSFNKSDSCGRNYIPPYNLGPTCRGENDYVLQKINIGFTWTSTNTLTYTLSVRDHHSLTLLAGHEATRTDRNLEFHGSNRNSLFNNPEYGYLDNFAPLDADNASLAEFGSSDHYGWAMLSYFGRLSYDFREKYLLTAVVRRDGSSNFAPGHRWGTFPSLSAGWVISKEMFMESVFSWLNYWKLRTSWGRNGNQNIEPFVYLANIRFEGANYSFGTNRSGITVGAALDRIPSPDVKWETSEQWDIGSDIILFTHLHVSLDCYRKETKDWLVTAPAHLNNGALPSLINGGNVLNKGMEVLVDYTVTFSGDLKLGLTITGAWNKNTITDVPTLDSIIHGQEDVINSGVEIFRAQTGYPTGYFWGYETDGVLQNQAEVEAWTRPDGQPYFENAAPGDLRFVDQNKDGELNEEDKVMIGDPNPDLIFGINLRCEYKGFQLQITGNGVAGNQVVKCYRRGVTDNFTRQEYDARWHGEGTSDRNPRILAASDRNITLFSDYFVYNADFFRISDLTLGYDFNRLTSIKPFNRLLLYVAVNNLYTLTKYPGIDPENGYSASLETWGSGIDIGTYASSRTWIAGLSITF